MMRRVKYLLLSCLCMYASGLLHGQDGLFLRAGVNACYAPLDSLNGVLARYNARSNPTKPFGEIHVPLGATFHLGYAGEKWILEVAYTGRQARAFAETEGNLGSLTQAVYVKYGAATGEVGLSYRFLPSIAAGLSLDFGAVSTKFRMGTRPQVNTDVYYRSSTGVTLGNSAFVQVDIPVSDRISIGARPYFHYNYFLADFVRLNQSINFNSFLNDPQFILGQTANGGFQASVAVWLR